MWPPIAPIIVPVIPARRIVPVVGFFGIGSHTYLNGGRSRQRGIDITPCNHAEHPEAQESEK
jgi:hypothetical protein